MATDACWKIQAADCQQQFLQLFGEYDWDLYKGDELSLIEQKVAYYIFGPCDTSVLKSDVLTSIRKVSTKIIEEDGHSKNSKKEVLMSVVYVSMVVHGTVLHEPVFKVPKNAGGSTALYIDIHARVYKDWNDFLKNNIFPSCEYCYPKGGEYYIDENDEVVLEFGISPAKKPSEKVLVGLDYTSLGISTAAVAVALLPVGGPLAAAAFWAGGACGLYSTVRSSTTLADKAKHKQSIGLRDPQARNCWLSIAGSTVGVAAMGATRVTAKMAQAGQVLGKAGCVTVNALNVGAISINGLGILNHAVSLIERKGDVSALDIVQFSASLFLFAHAAVKVKTAETIIKETQTNVINDFKASLRSNRHRKAFNKITKNSVGQQDTVTGNAKIIRAIRHISNVDDFFASIVRMDKQVKQTGSKITITEHGLIEVNQQVSVDPIRLCQLDKTQRTILFEATKDFSWNSISEEQFKNLTNSVLEQVSSLPPTESFVITGASEQNASRSKALFSVKMSAVGKATLTTILSTFTAKLQEEILVVAKEICRKMNFRVEERICEVVYIVCGFARSVADELGITEKSSQETRSIHGMAASNWEFYFTMVLKRIVSEEWIEIYKHCSILYRMLGERRAFNVKYDHIGVFQIAQCGIIITKFDMPLYERLIDVGLYIFDELRCKEGVTLFIIIKLICKYIQKVAKDMTQKYTDKDMSLWEMLKAEASEEFNDICSIALDSILEDNEVRRALMGRFSEAISNNKMEIE